MDLDTAIKTAKSEVKNPYAQAYLKAIPDSIEMGGSLGNAKSALKVQLLYALNNMSGWRGSVAREVKAVMKKFASN